MWEGAPFSGAFSFLGEKMVLELWVFVAYAAFMRTERRLERLSMSTWGFYEDKKKGGVGVYVHIGLL